MEASFEASHDERKRARLRASHTVRSYEGDMGMSRIIALGLVLAGLFVAPVAALAHGAIHGEIAHYHAGRVAWIGLHRIQVSPTLKRLPLRVQERSNVTTG